MEIIKIPMGELTPDPNNAKDHPKPQVEQIKASIEQFGNLDPIGVWGDNNLIVEGHGRFMALQELGYQEAECIRLDWLTEEERKAYALAHNKLTMNSGFDPDLLELNLDDVGEIDMSLFGFDGGGSNAAGSSGGENGGTQSFNYSEQYGVIVMCADEAEQEKIYNRLTGEGYECKVVAV